MKRKFTATALALIMAIVCCVGPMSSAAFAGTYSSAFPVCYSTVKGNTVSVSADGFKAAVVVYGNIYCYNTISLIDGINESDWGKSGEVALYYADANDNSKAAVSGFAAEHGGKFTYCYDTGNDLWYYAKQLNISGSVTFPVAVVLDENDDVQYISTGYTTEDKVHDAIRKFTTLSCDTADPTVDIDVTGRYNYTYANEVLSLINKERAKEGLDALDMYRELLDSSMYRAAELSIRYSYSSKPNGRSYNGRYAIAFGCDTPTEAVAEWMETYLSRSKLLNSSYVGAGVGCFEIVNGNDTVRYWVVSFATYSYGYTQSTRTGSQQTTVSVPARLSCLKLDLNITEDGLVITNDSEGEMPLSAFTVTSGNPSVAAISTSGDISVKGFGETTITAQLNAYPKLTVSTVYTLKAPAQAKLSKKISSDKSSVTLYWTKDASVSGYIIQQYKNGKWVTVKTVADRNAIRLSKLSSGRTYKYRVRPFVTVNGKKLYGKYSNVAKIRI